MQERDKSWWSRAIELRAAGLQYKQIARRLGKSPEGVRYAIDAEARARNNARDRERYAAVKAARVPAARKRTEPGWWRMARHLQSEEGYTFQEIAWELGKSKAAVRYALNPKTREAARRHMAKWRGRPREPRVFLMAAE